MWTSPEYETSLILLYGLIQSMRLPCSAQNPSGSLYARSYIALYLASSAHADFASDGDTGNTWPCGMGPTPLELLRFDPIIGRKTGLKQGQRRAPRARPGSELFAHRLEAADQQ